MYIPTLSNNQTKNSIRELILNTISTIDIKYGKVLTLPCLNFELENKLSSKYLVHTIEREVEYYNQQLQITKYNKRITNYNTTVLEHVIYNKNYYDFAYLDFCSYISKEIVAVLALIKCDNIAITLLRKRDKARWTKYSKDRNDMYTKLFNSLGYRITTQVNYINNGSPMTTIFITKN